MGKKRAAPTEALSRLFGPPPLLYGESAEAYDELLERVFKAVQPVDFTS